ncbi:MAG: BatA and WFA domain-containing protein, partial [Planctomycetaceae bacterium]
MNLPGFHSLGSAWLFALLIPLLILYFLKLKRPRMEVPSLALWQQVINDQRVNSPFQKFKRNILLLLQLLMLCALCLAAMQPFMRGGPEQYDNLPVLIDCSASMAARDQPDGQTRLDVAREQVEALIDGLTGNQRLALIAVTSTGRRLTEFTDNKRILREALSKLKVADVPGELEDAMRMTLAMSRTEPIESVIVLSDGNFPERVDFELPFNLNYQQIPAGGENLGVIEFNARRSKQSEWDVFVRVAGNVVKTMGADVELLQDGTPIAEQTIVINGDESQRLSFRVTADAQCSLQVKLKPDSFDSLESDNVAWLDLPEGRDLRVYADTGLASWRHALSGVENLELYPLSDDASEPPQYDAIVSDSSDGLEMDVLVKVMLGVIPPDLRELIEPSEGQTEIVDWNRTEPLLQHVQLSDITIVDPPARKEGVVDNQIEE